jgi:hypothetical protein
MKSLIAVAQGILLMASAFDVAVHLIGLGWFTGSLSPYTVAVDLVIVLGIIAGGASLFTSRLPRVNWFVIALLILAVIALAVLPLTPTRVEFPWSSAALVGIYLARALAVLHQQRNLADVRSAELR